MTATVSGATARVRPYRDVVSLNYKLTKYKVRIGKPLAAKDEKKLSLQYFLKKLNKY